MPWRSTSERGLIVSYSVANLGGGAKTDLVWKLNGGYSEAGKVFESGNKGNAELWSYRDKKQNTRLRQVFGIYLRFMLGCGDSEACGAGAFGGGALGRPSRDIHLRMSPKIHRRNM